MKKIKVLIVDDSAVVRQSLAYILETDKSIEILGTASDPFIAAQKIANEVPDVITLDIEMPRMDGITFLRKIMSQHPIPVVIISSLTAKGTETAIHALEIGAVDVVKKPTLNKDSISDAEHNIIEVVKAAAKAVVKRRGSAAGLRQPVSVKALQNLSMLRTTEKIIAVGASTGGTEALLEFLNDMPIDCPGVVVVQHMPELFTKSFADRLNRICKISVKEAVNGDSILRGQALIAPGNRHMEVKRSGARYYVEIKDGSPVNRHRPSVDVLFSSTAKYAGRNAIGIIMTGMGADGAKGLLEMKEAGAYTIAQDEKSCIVFGMPKEAIKINAVDKILPLSQIASHLLSQK
ncbi:protein-glutamate methylesterase/protein-glutamine glutaminase [Chryseosolibacter indicus]|uniref:Protein-glutamate methylesterase/protein-glutamine glutaminase n=1 Tax=Chryseosolibacter indicus TaxID=2782351 RepID=A0ABS5VVJ5_9BACT|nr:chemotaxis response regulator protein-glutamate methylesterase [Chryseosolibacter indicus]MBT1705068.1 chemotaxis response regulator protein-glutamate methylesterase [Chryseosolibacter indicus]